MSTDIFDRLTAPEVPALEEETALQPQGDETQADEQQPNEIQTPMAVKQCCQELLKFGLLEMERKPHLYQTALTRQDAISRLFEPFDLSLQLDDIRGLAFLSVAETVVGEAQDDDWAHPLVRRQRLTLEQSLLVAILRKQFLIHEQEAGVGAGGALVFVDELIPELQVYLGDLGSDLKEQERIHNLLERLKGHGIVSEVNDKDQVTVRPIIAHMANPENLQALLAQYRDLTAPGNEQA